MGCVANTGNPIKSLENNQNIRESVSSLSKKPKIKQKAIDNRLKSVEYSDIPTAVIKLKKKQPKDLKLIQNAMKKHFIFNSLTPDQFSQVTEQMKYYKTPANATIFEQNSTGNNFFIISSGKVEVLVNNIRKSILKPGDNFGELALLHGTLRMSTIRTLEKTNFWTIDRKTFKQIVYSINTLSYKENKAFIENVSIFRVLNEHQKELLLNSVNTLKFTDGFFIVNDGEPGQLLYIIKEGKVEVVKEGVVIREMHKGDYFGEQALLYKQNRTASVRTIGNVVCLSIEANNLNEALGSNLQHIIYKNSLKIAIENDSVLKRLTCEQVRNLADAVSVYCYKEGCVVAKGGTGAGFNLFVVVKGMLKMDGKVFGLFSCVSSAQFCSKSDECFVDDLVAGEDSDVGIISVEFFEKIIGGEFSEVSLYNEILSTLTKIPLFSTLNSKFLHSTIKSLKLQEFSPQSTIFQISDPGDSLFIIRSGEISLQHPSKPEKILSKFSHFGKSSFLFSLPRSTTAIANTKTELLILTRSEFLNLFPEATKLSLLRRIELQDTKIQLQDLCPVKLVGKGMFGNVFFTIHKTRKTFYALKTVHRKKISAYSLYSNIIHERKVLLLMDHCMIMKLVKTFKDSDRIYFLLEYVLGVDMFDVLRILQLLSEPDAKFYSACLACILEYIHSKGVVFRDLKPENIVIDSEGYPKLVDFGISKIIAGRTFSLVGTPHYMSPEIIEGKGYNHLSDYWSLGIIIFEFICGSLPFGDDDSEPLEIYKQILEHNLIFPSWIDSSSLCKSIIQQLLSPNPLNRISKNNDLKSHSWFSNMNWDKLQSKQIKPPYIPQIPDLSSEISSVLSLDQNLFEVIASEELNDIISQTNRQKEPEENWDDEF